MRGLWTKLQAIFRRRSLDRDLEAELQFHIEMQIEENLRNGMPLAEARAHALRSFGGLTQIRETYRDRRGFRSLDSLMQDLRFGWRMLRRSPVFTAVAVLTMALGIGASTAVFSVVSAIVLRPLRFPDPQRLMVILSVYGGRGEGSLSAAGVYVDWKERSTSFEAVAGARYTQMIFTGTEQARIVSIGAVSRDFFPLTGARPIRGRFFSEAEDRQPQPAVALLDAGFWRREFGGDARILGRTIVLDQKPFTVIGVLPEDLRFAYFGATDIWVPLAANREWRGGGDVVTVGRLRPGVTQQAAQAEMDAIMRQIRREHQEDSLTDALVKPLHDWIVGDVRRTFLVLLGAVAFVLLICCANIANLLLARTAARQHEMAIRAALGAGRGRLVRQILVESVMLSLLGGLLGAALAVIAVRAFPAFHAFYIPRLEEVSVDHTILVVAMVVAMGSGILFGLAPASQFGRRNPAAALHSGDAASFVRVAGIRLRNVLVTTQLALAVVLLSGAGLMTNTLIRLLRVDLGFERDHLVVIQTILPFRKYTPVTSAEFVRKLAAEVERLPGVVAASAADHVPLEAVLSPYDLRAAQSGSQNVCHALARHIDRKFLAVMGIPLLAGRDFEPADDRRSPIPVLINPVAARALFGTDNPLGRQILTDYRSRPRLEVVGVVGNVRQIGLATEPGAQIYLPLIYGPARNVAARATISAAILSPSIRAAVRALDRDAPPPEIGTMDDWFSRHTARPRFYLGLLAAFAGAGLLLAAIGVYGVISYTVERRTREFGIRMALGATPRDVLRLVLGIGARLTLAGAVVGLAGAVAATRLLAVLLYGVKPGDPLTLAAVVLLLAGVALAACYLGARKATQADPSAALRCE